MNIENNHLFYNGRRDCRTPLFCEILLAVLTRLMNPFEGQLGSYRWDWNSLRRGSDNLFGIVDDLGRCGRAVEKNGSSRSRHDQHDTTSKSANPNTELSRAPAGAGRGCACPTSRALTFLFDEHGFDVPASWAGCRLCSPGDRYLLLTDSPQLPAPGPGRRGTAAHSDRPRSRMTLRPNLRFRVWGLGFSVFLLRMVWGLGTN